METNAELEQPTEQVPDVAQPATPQTQPEAKTEKPTFDLKKLLSDHPELQTILDQQSGNARKEGREAARKKLLEELGVADVESVKTVLQTAEQKRLAELSELEQLREAKKKAEDERDAVRQAQVEALEKTKKFLVAQELKAIAAELKFNDADDLKNFLDVSKIEVDLDSTTVSGIRAQAEAIAKAKPYLIKQEQPVTPVETKPANPAPALPAAASPQPEKKNDDQKRAQAFRPRF